MSYRRDVQNSPASQNAATIIDGNAWERATVYAVQIVRRFEKKTKRLKSYMKDRWKRYEWHYEKYVQRKKITHDWYFLDIFTRLRWLKLDTVSVNSILNSISKLIQINVCRGLYNYRSGAYKCAWTVNWLQLFISFHLYFSALESCTEQIKDTRTNTVPRAHTEIPVQARDESKNSSCEIEPVFLAAWRSAGVTQEFLEEEQYWDLGDSSQPWAVLQWWPQRKNACVVSNESTKILVQTYIACRRPRFLDPKVHRRIHFCFATRPEVCCAK